jgi:hypothetical protein
MPSAEARAAASSIASGMPSSCRQIMAIVVQQRPVRQDIRQHRDIRSDHIFGLAALINDMNDAAACHMRYRSYGGVPHDLFRSYVPGPLTFADPLHRLREHAQLNGVNLAVGAAHAARSDKISGFDVTQTTLSRRQALI